MKSGSRSAPRSSPPLVRAARVQAHGLLAAILGERITFDEALARQPLQGAAEEQRFARALVLTCLRHLGRIDALLRQCLDKPLPNKRLAVSNALRLGVVQLLLLDTPSHAAVHESVALLKKGKDAGLCGLVNAVLQKIMREGLALPSVSENLPHWVQARWQAAYGKAAVAVIAEVAGQRPPLDIQVRGDVEGGVRLDAHIVRMAADREAVVDLPGYAEGAFFVQDVAASYPVRLFGAMEGVRVLDVCAAPGGKAMQMVRAGAQVTALDRSAARMQRVHENVSRLRMQVDAVVADALVWTPDRQFDAILLDAPCTATGTWRRHPEVVHLLAPEDIEEMVAVQRALLTRAWQWLAPGGRLVYCVCSLEPEEGEAQMAWFQQQVRAVLVPASEMAASQEIPPECCTPRGYLRTLPGMWVGQGGMDGFFAACFCKP